MDPTIVLNEFGIEDPTNQKLREAFESGVDLSLQNLEPSSQLSGETWNQTVKGLWEKIQDGLTLGEIDNLLFFILFLRFLILASRYNLKTSFYITCIGMLAGYFWYKHFIDLISMYKTVLFKIPFLHRLGTETVQVRSLNSRFKVEETIHWSQPGKIFYSAFTKGIVNKDPETGLQYYMDPISMLISTFPEKLQAKILPVYYQIYREWIPKVFQMASKFWFQFSGIASYALITRIGKRYCPYLIRWHWTFLLIFGLLQRIVVSFIYRVYYFQNVVLLPQTKGYETGSGLSLDLQLNLLNGLITLVVLTHLGFVISGLLHAICGQYFYFPFLVENTELHVGDRPAYSIYSGGYTSWQDSKEKNVTSGWTKLWYGWFGRGTKTQSSLWKNWILSIKKSFQRLKKRF